MTLEFNYNRCSTQIVGKVGNNKNYRKLEKYNERDSFSKNESNEQLILSPY